MNPTGEPLDQHALDELLSADVDGELAAAAADLGLTGDEARAAISSPAAIARRAAIAGAAEAIGAFVPFDDDAAARLVTESLTRGREDDELAVARQRRKGRTDTARVVAVLAGSAAAVIAVIVGLSNLSMSSNDANSAATRMPVERATTSDGAPTPGPLALGDVSDTKQLRRRVEAQLQSPLSSPQPGGSTTSFRVKSGPPPKESYAADDAAQRLQLQCTPAARTAAGGAAPVLAGNARSHGRTVVVYVFRRGAGYDVVVVDQGCSVVTRLSLP
jgi:hypothetical protein